MTTVAFVLVFPKTVKVTTLLNFLLETYEIVVLRDAIDFGLVDVYRRFREPADSITIYTSSIHQCVIRITVAS